MEDVRLNIVMKVRIALNRNNSNHVTWIFDTSRRQQLLILTPTQGYFLGIEELGSLLWPLGQFFALGLVLCWSRGLGVDKSRDKLSHHTATPWDN